MNYKTFECNAFNGSGQLWDVNGTKIVYFDAEKNVKFNFQICLTIIIFYQYVI